MNNKYPLIKEYRIEKLEKCLECIDKYPFGRDKQRKCILEQYKEKNEKSVFRGMVIPSLRDLGLILGFSDLIKISGNGKLIIESKNKSKYLHLRILRVIFTELDSLYYKILAYFEDRNNKMITNLHDIVEDIGNLSARQKKERIQKWFLLLEQLNFFKHEKYITLNNDIIRQVKLDLKISVKQKNNFIKYVFESYKTLGRDRANIVDIVDLRQEVMLTYLHKNIILTENQFDKLLRLVPFATDKYLISLGSSMGGSKLFEHNGKKYRTMTIRFI